MPRNPAADTVDRLDAGALQTLVSGCFQASGMRPDMADDAAEMLVLAEMMGIHTHGLGKVESYIARLRDGGVSGDALPVITRPAPALLQVDGRNGLGAAVALRATRAAMDTAREVGMAAAFCRASSHLGALAPQLLQAANAGFAAVFVTNTSPMIAPDGGTKPVFGNTPLGIAIPDETGTPVILDIALSVAARSKVRRAAAKGAPIPDTWATDKNGLPTTDATEAMQGFMQAIGGTKGANLSLCLDLLAGGLSGAAMLAEVPNANKDSAAVANIGHLLLVIDAAKLMPPERLASRIKDARGYVRQSVAADTEPKPRLPGERALACLAEARREGVAIDADLRARLEALAAA
ncbi:MAG: Ldh family oxidoreductase [Paracoccaceae bacterium]